MTKSPFSPIARLFRQPSLDSVVLEELAQAELDLLQAQSQMEYASAMLIYHTSRVTRLRKVESTRAGTSHLRAVL